MRSRYVEGSTELRVFGLSDLVCLLTSLLDSSLNLAMYPCICSLFALIFLFLKNLSLGLTLWCSVNISVFHIPPLPSKE